jgi:hypothetical protein
MPFLSMNLSIILTRSPSSAARDMRFREAHNF